jgi:transcription elongation factor GreB
MNQNSNYITPAGFEKLRNEYIELLNKERPKIVETVTWAASNGDRSENADYQYGKRRLREIDRRLHFLQKRMEASEVIDPLSLKSDKVIFGATITLENENGDIKKYQIVG